MYGELIGLKAKNPAILIEKVSNGLPYKSLGRLSKNIGVPERELAGIIHIPPRTMARRKTGGRLNSLESQRLWRIARVYERAEEVLKDMDRVKRWFRSPIRGLGYKTPLELIDTEPGAVEVENMLGRIEDGVFY